MAEQTKPHASLMSTSMFKKRNMEEKNTGVIKAPSLKLGYSGLGEKVVLRFLKENDVFVSLYNMLDKKK